MLLLRRHVRSLSYSIRCQAWTHGPCVTLQDCLYGPNSADDGDSFHPPAFAVFLAKSDGQRHQARLCTGWTRPETLRQKACYYIRFGPLTRVEFYQVVASVGNHRIPCRLATPFPRLRVILWAGALCSRLTSRRSMRAPLAGDGSGMTV
jgi:hypothetical protein